MSPASSLRERYLHSAARHVVEGEIHAFLDGPARGKTVWDLGAGVPPLARPTPIRTVDSNRDGRPTVVADLEALPLAPASVEAALAVAVLEHVRHPTVAADELARVLAPGAPLFVWVPFLHELHLYPRDLWRFTPDGIRALLESRGFVTHSCGAGRLSGLVTVLSHLYRFAWPPLPPLFGARLAGFALLERLQFLDRWSPAADWPIGATWIGTRTSPTLVAASTLSVAGS